MHLPYDETNPKSIKQYAQALLDNSLRHLVDIDEGSIDPKNKGDFGHILEKYYFFYDLKPDKEPDFPKACVELKSSPLKKLKRGDFVSKERLVLNIINYNEIITEKWKENQFLSKNSLLLLIFYLWEQDKNVLDQIIKLVDLWKFPDEDLKIIKDDWIKIQKKVLDGKAHEISEGDTLFLGACVKGSQGGNKREQPFNKKIKAKQRAYSLKQKYVNFIIHQFANKRFGPERAQNWGYKAERIAKSLREYNEGETLENLVYRKFKPYFGKSIPELKTKFNLEFAKTSKHKTFLIIRAILGISEGKKIEEFEKADVEIKSITLEKNGRLKESMSFPHIIYKEIIRQKFEDSPIYEKLTKRFFFIIFEKNEKKIPLLKKVKFWAMPKKDLNVYRKLFNDTKRKIKKGIYDDFIKISDDMIGHIRPHGRNSDDKIETPTNTLEIKRCFWLNSKYIKEQINK